MVFFILFIALVVYVIIRIIINNCVFFPVLEEIPENLDFDAKVTKVIPFISTTITFSDGYSCTYNKTKKWLTISGRHYVSHEIIREDLVDKMVLKAIERHQMRCEEKATGIKSRKLADRLYEYITTHTNNY